MTRHIRLLAMVLAGCSQVSREPQSRVADARPACSGIGKARMVWIDGGAFTLGEGPQYAEEGPPRRIRVAGFWMSETEVTNTQFAAFVKATGYRTDAERAPTVASDAPAVLRKPGSAVFREPTSDNPNWWVWAPGAQWRRPDGRDSDAAARPSDPVVQVTYRDARAYAAWAGLSLPSEAQWEYAARAGEAALPEPVGLDGKATANTYQGAFPVRDTGADGFAGRAPVGCFAANAFGLHDMIGNVWEWTTIAAPSADAAIIKGGSFLCSKNYCARYRAAARQFQERDLGTDHIGFRVVDNRRAPPAR